MTIATSRLAGVNEVLRLLGLSTVTELGSGRSAQVAEASIATAVRELQTKGWWFNRGRYTPTITSMDWCHLPPGLVLDEGENSSKYSVRDGRRVYNRDTRSYDLGDTLSVVVDDDDLSTGSWTATNATATVAPNAPVPGGGALDSYRVATTSSGGYIYQTFSAGLTNGTKYTVGVYCGVGDNESPADAVTSRLSMFGVSSSRRMGVDFDHSGSGPFTGADARGVGEISRIEFIPVSDRLTLAGDPEWYLVLFDFTYETADGDLRLELYPAVGGEGDVLFWRPFFTLPADGPELKVVEILDFEDTPAVVQNYLVRRAATETGAILSVDGAARQHAARREAEAWAALQRAEASENRSSMLNRSPSVARTIGSLARQPALSRLYGKPLRGTDV